MCTAQRMGWGLLAALVMAGCTPTPATTPPPVQPIRGTVLTCHKGRGSVVLDVGRKHGVLKGHVFIVRRRGEHIGTIVVQTVRDEMSACTIWRTRDEIASGDEAETEPPRR